MPSSSTMRGPRWSISQPTSGARNAETRKPNENTPAVAPRSPPNSSRIGGEKSEEAVGGVTPHPQVTNTDPATNQPQKKSQGGGGEGMKRENPEPHTPPRREP